MVSGLYAIIPLIWVNAAGGGGISDAGCEEGCVGHAR